MGMTNDGLSYWQAEDDGISLLEMTPGQLLDRRAEELLAVVIPKQGEHLTEAELREYCKGKISHQKIPRYFQFVESYPLTASGKVQKFVLRQNAIKALGLEDAANIKTA
jgi:acyl-CoA synthetase (AMP-forming)/AMP-acid ligase II